MCGCGEGISSLYSYIGRDRQRQRSWRSKRSRYVATRLQTLGRLIAPGLYLIRLRLSVTGTRVWGTLRACVAHMERVFREGCAFAERLYGGSPLDGMASGIMTWFAGGHFGPWRVLRIDRVIGSPLAWVPRLEVAEQPPDPATDGWVLRGVTSFERYVTRAERVLLEGRQQGLGRPSATRAASFPSASRPRGGTSHKTSGARFSRNAPTIFKRVSNIFQL